MIYYYGFQESSHNYAGHQPMTELLLVIYYTAVLSGMLLCGVHVVRIFLRNSPINESLFWVLSLGFCPVIISWLGFAGVFRLAGMRCASSRSTHF